MDKIDENIAVQCENKEEAVLLLNEANRLGYKWDYGGRYTDNYNWMGSEYAYRVKAGFQDDLDWYEGRYSVVKFSDIYKKRVEINW